MSPLNVASPARLDLAGRVALVRAQLAPIPSRLALLDSYRRESICRLSSPCDIDSAADVLELAYALRWAELEGSPVAEGGETWEFLDG